MIINTATAPRARPARETVALVAPLAPVEGEAEALPVGEPDEPDEPESEPEISAAPEGAKT